MITKTLAEEILEERVEESQAEEILIERISGLGSQKIGQCIKQHVIHAAKAVKFLSNQPKASQFTVMHVLKRIRIPGPRTGLINLQGS